MARTARPTRLLDKAVDAAYGYKACPEQGQDDAARLAFLFKRYQKIVAPPHQSDHDAETP
jgi:hypothetical protein